MSRQGAVFQSDADKHPGYAVMMQNEGLVAGHRRITGCSCRRLVVGRPVPIKVRDVQAGPLLFLLIPPNELLSLTPGFPVRTRRGTVVKDAPIGWPGKAPSMTVEVA